MYTNDELIPVLSKVDLLLLELKELRSRGPHFKIWHRFRESGSDCVPGEEIAGIFLIYRSHEIFVPLSLTLRLLFDLLARHSRLPQDASQIAAAMRADPFYRRHGTRASVHVKFSRKISRSSVKVSVARIRLALAQAFQEANVDRDPRTVLISENMFSNAVGYRLRATFEWAHEDHPAPL